MVRRTLAETPAFEQEAPSTSVAKLPLAVLFRDHRADVLRVDRSPR